MKVLLVAPYGGHTGGIERWASHIMNYYNYQKSHDKSSVELDVLPTNDSFDMALHTSGIKRILYGVKTSLSKLKKIHIKLRHEKYDILHITTSASYGAIRDVLILIYLKIKGQRVVLHYHFGRIPILASKKNWEWKAIQTCVKLATKVIVIDSTSYNVLKNNKYENVFYLPNPVAPIVEQLIKKTPVITREKGFVFFAGHGLRTKGVYELVEACKDIPEVNLKMSGTISDEVKNDLKRIASYRDNAQWLDIAGNCSYDDVIADMCRCDIFILPSYSEGFPNVILESMACSCAIISTKVGAIPEMLETEEGRQYGVLINPRSIEEIHNSIVMLINNETLKNEMRINVKRRVLNRYSIEIIWNQLVSMWLNNSNDVRN